MSGEFAGTFKERVRIERPVATRTESGLQQAGWEPVATCRAAIVAEGAGPEAEGQALSAMPRFRVTIRRRDGISLGQRVVWGGRTMLVKQRIDDPVLPDRVLLPSGRSGHPRIGSNAWPDRLAQQGAAGH